MTTTMKTERRPSALGRRLAQFVQAWLVAPVVRWHKRNELYREMMDLDDRTLADIGISRFDIPYFVRNTPVDADMAETGSSNEDEPAHRDDHDPDQRLAA